MTKGGFILDIVHSIRSNNKKNLSMEEVIEEIFWSNLNEITREDMISVVKPYLLEADDIREISGIQKLYLNPDGAHIDIFEDIIIMLYSRNPLKFIKATMENPDEGLNVLYIFRNRGVFTDYKIQMNELIENEESSEMVEEIDAFFRMYDSLCHT